MAPDEENDQNAKKDWLTEHETIQDDLLDIKADLMKELMTNQEGRRDEAGGEGDKKPEYNEESNIPHAEPISDDQGQSRTRSEPSSGSINTTENTPSEAPEKAHAEPTIKDLLGVKSSNTPEQPESKSLRREDTSSIPKHPELTNYIAKVIEHESKIKRRIFEKEKQETRMAREDRKSKKDRKGKKKGGEEEKAGGKNRDEENKSDQVDDLHEMHEEIGSDDIDSILPDKLDIGKKKDKGDEDLLPSDSKIEWESEGSGDEEKADRSVEKEGEHDQRSDDDDGAGEEEKETHKPFFRLKKFFRRIKD